MAQGPPIIRLVICVWPSLSEDPGGNKAYLRATIVSHSFNDVIGVKKQVSSFIKRSNIPTSYVPGGTRLSVTINNTFHYY